MYERRSRGAAPKIELKRDMLGDYLWESSSLTLGCLGFSMVCLLLFAAWALHEVRHPKSPSLPYCRQEQGRVWLSQCSVVATCMFRPIRHVLTKAWIIDMVNWEVSIYLPHSRLNFLLPCLSKFWTSPWDHVLKIWLFGEFGLKSRWPTGVVSNNKRLTRSSSPPIHSHHNI